MNDFHTGTREEEVYRKLSFLFIFVSVLLIYHLLNHYHYLFVSITLSSFRNIETM